MANEMMFLHSGYAEDMWYYRDGYDYHGEYNTAGYFKIGKGVITPENVNVNARSAIRFRNITLPQGNVNYAGLYMWVQNNGDGLSPRSGNWTFRVYGFDEDNTASFGSYPFGRPQTTDYSESNNSSDPGTGQWKEINVTSAINEILSRAGWQSGNSLALWIDPYDCGPNMYASDSSDRRSFLVIRKDADPNFTPTAKSVAAPTFPAAKSFGWKQAYPEHNVFTATEDQLYITTRKRNHKLIAEGVVNTTANTIYSIAHGQSYIPFCLVYVKSNTTSARFKLPRWFPVGPQSGPDGDDINGYVEINATNLRIMTTENAEVYYRIFVDELP